MAEMGQQRESRETVMSEATTLASIERQLERDALFTHTTVGRSAIRICEVESFTYGLIDVLLAKGLVSEEELLKAAENVRTETAEKGEALGPGVMLRVDPPETIGATPVLVNCAERMPICHSICCKLDFPLTAEEVESGAVRWDLGRPYQVRHETDGHCTHRDRTTGFCGVYDCRPGICRTYSCAHDTRIWKDFERMELNTEWITEHLTGQSRPCMAGAMLYQIERRSDAARSNSEGESK
jgi:Fe-S-cluster containining protein